MPEILKEEPSRCTPKASLPSTTEELRAKSCMCANTAAVAFAETYMPGIVNAQLTTEEGAGCVCTWNAVMMPKESAAPRRA